MPFSSHSGKFFSKFLGQVWYLFDLFWQVLFANTFGKFDVSFISSGNFCCCCKFDASLVSSYKFLLEFFLQVWCSSMLQVWCLFGVFLQVFFWAKLMPLSSLLASWMSYWCNQEFIKMHKRTNRERLGFCRIMVFSEKNHEGFMVILLLYDLLE